MVSTFCPAAKIGHIVIVVRYDVHLETILLSLDDQKNLLLSLELR